MVFMSSYAHQEGFHYWMRMKASDVTAGKFIDTKEDASLWNCLHKKQTQEEESCPYQELPHSFTHRLLEDHPLEAVNLSELFSHVWHKLNGRVSANSFDKLSPRHK